MGLLVVPLWLSRRWTSAPGRSWATAPTARLPTSTAPWLLSQLSGSRRTRARLLPLGPRSRVTGRSSLWRRRRPSTAPPSVKLWPRCAPTGEGKSILGCVLVAVSIGIWGYFWMKSVVYGALPDTITSDEKQKAQIDRMIAIRANPVEGISSNYDYEKGQWKK